MLFAESRVQGGDDLESEREPTCGEAAARAEVRTPGLCSSGQG